MDWWGKLARRASSTSARAYLGEPRRASPEMFDIGVSEITGNAFIFINPAKVLENFSHHSVSFLHKNVYLVIKCV